MPNVGRPVPRSRCRALGSAAIAKLTDLLIADLGTARGPGA